MNKIELAEIQVRHESGNTPCFKPHQLREVFALMSRESEDPVFKLMLDFRDSEGNHYHLTLREVSEGKWILYGDSINPPSFTEVAQALSSG